jgi:hypothetical protein
MTHPPSATAPYSPSGTGEAPLAPVNAFKCPPSILHHFASFSVSYTICILLIDVFCGNHPFSPPDFTVPLHASWNTQARSQRHSSPPNAYIIVCVCKLVRYNDRATPTIHLKTIQEEHYHTDVNPPFSDASTLVQ